MSFLRHARHIIRPVLVWFVLSLGVAVASPLVAPQSTLLVCSGASVKMVVLDADGGGTEVGHSTLDCPLCATLSAPPPVLVAAVAPPHALSHALVPIEAARIAARIGAAWQARAPPAFS
jgi:hypothetical protein